MRRMIVRLIAKIANLVGIFLFARVIYGTLNGTPVIQLDLDSQKFVLNPLASLALSLPVPLHKKNHSSQLMNRNFIFYFRVITVGSMLLASCMRPPAQNEASKTAPLLQNQSYQKTYVYECINGYNFSTRADDENAYLFLPDKTARLAKVPSASGAKYSNGLITFWSKGDEALLDTGDIIYRDCKNNRAKAIWENAKLNGIDFRAVGNEPGWYLEIKASDKIRFVSSYGQDRYEFTTPEPKIDKQARMTTYTTYNDANTLKIVIRGTTCRDSMSGESFATTVMVTLDNTKFQGCGRALH